MFFSELGLPAPDRELGIALGSNTSQTARMLTALEPLLGETCPGRRARLRRHQLDARRGAGGGPGRGPGRPCRGGDAVVRSLDAGGAQSGPDRSRQHAAAVLLAGCGRQPRPRGRGWSGRARWRRDGRRRAGGAATRSRAARPRRRSRRRARRRTCSRLRTAPATSTIPTGCGCSWICWRRAPMPVVLPLHPRTRARLSAAGLLGRLERG